MNINFMNEIGTAYLDVNDTSIKKKNITGGIRYSNHDNWKEEYVEFVYTESHLSEVLARLATTFKYISEINTSDTKK